MHELKIVTFYQGGALDIQSIISGVEDFYEVWSDGVSGSVLDVQRMLSDDLTIDKQFAKKIIANPLKISGESSLVCAKEELDRIEGTGLKCKLRHVGPALLDNYSNEDIEYFLSDLSKDGRAVLRPYDKGYRIFIGDTMLALDTDEIEFYFYLACIRYLAKAEKVEKT